MNLKKHFPTPSTIWLNPNPTRRLKYGFKMRLALVRKVHWLGFWRKEATEPMPCVLSVMSGRILYGSVCPQTGATHGLLLPYADLEGMQLYLDDFSHSIPNYVFIVLICDQAGWHTSGKLQLPDCIQLLSLPPKSPELNPAELLWREIRQKHLGNRVFPDVDSMCDEVSTVWRNDIENPQSIASLCGFDWITDYFNWNRY